MTVSVYEWVKLLIQLSKDSMDEMQISPAVQDYVLSQEQMQQAVLRVAQAYMVHERACHCGDQAKCLAEFSQAFKAEFRVQFLKHLAIS